VELWRRAANPWGQEVLIGISWDLMWAAVFAGLAFTLAHAVWAKWLAPAASTEASGGSSVAGLPAQILRHALSERVFHWVMSAAMLVLLITAFAPVMGIQFPWVTIHWIAGLVLTATILYHIVHATFWQDFWAMWVNKADIQAGMAEVGHMLGRNGTAVPKAAKYPIDHKMFHHGAAVSGLVAIVTGIFMMLRIDTWLGAANPYLLDISDSSWGVVYVVHGISGVALFGLIITHIYFAIRPDKWWITKSMIYGFIGRDKYEENFDPARWVIPGAEPQQGELVPAGVGSPVGGGDDAAASAGGGDLAGGGGNGPAGEGDATAVVEDAPARGDDEASGESPSDSSGERTSEGGLD
jgi:cytochrome b subunit of formate dehydrogenase